MTERKPAGQSWESWIDRQVRRARERGAFDNLPGAGAPLRGLDRPFDELWWVKNKLHQEGLSYLPPSVALRREAHEALQSAARADSEAEARAILEAINDRIREANRRGIRGPSLMLVPFDVERLLQEWRARR